MIYLAAIGYIALSVVLNIWVTRHYENAWWSMIIYAATAPGVLALFPTILIYSTAYPDRHVNAIDFYGTDEAKHRLNQYRDACNKRSFVRRFLEGLHVLRYTGPEYPEFFDDDLPRPNPFDDAEQ